MKITNEQKKQIHRLTSTLGFSDQAYRYYLESRYAVRSCLDLTHEQAEEVIYELKAEVAEQEKEKMITDKQVGYIKFLWLSVDYDQGNCGDKHLSSFLERKYKVRRPEELTKRQALGCISAIKRMQANLEKKVGSTSVSAIITADGKGGTMWVQLPNGQRYACPIKIDENYERPN